MGELRVIPPEEFRWPTGVWHSAGLVDAPPQRLEAQAGLAFHSGHDDLDYFRAAGVELPSGRRVVLWWYERAGPPHGLDLRVDAGDDPAAARAEALSALGLSARDLIWVPDAAGPEVTNLASPPQVWEGTIFVVLRRDPDALAPSDFVAMGGFWREQDAHQYVTRANALSAGSATRYAYQRTNLFRGPRPAPPAAGPPAGSPPAD
jgi:hypothetical protein